MKAILFSLGSRGDIEPFLALGEILRDKNWEIICVFPEQFREMVEKEGYSFYGFNKEFIEILILSKKANLITGGEGSLLKRIRTLSSLTKSVLNVNKEITNQQRDITNQEKPDYIFYNQKCIYPIIWGMKNQNRSILVNSFPCLFHKVKSHSIIGLKGGGDYGAFLNTLSYSIPNLVRSVVIHRTTKRFHKEFKGLKINPLKISNAILKKEKSFYTISPTLFPKPNDWHGKVNVVGYYERSKTKDWKPDNELLDFIQTHKKIVFISFGSISNPNPEEKTSIILNILKKHKIPAIINTSWGGLIKPNEHPDHIHFVQNIPYDWIFPKVYAVVHHGGSGTTHTALKFGCASLVIPHFIDQFFWNKTVAKLGAGPKGISIKKLNEKDFEFKLLDLLKNEGYKKKAKLIAVKMQNESDKNKLYEMIIK